MLPSVWWLSTDRVLGRTYVEPRRPKPCGRCAPPLEWLVAARSKGGGGGSPGRALATIAWVALLGWLVAPAVLILTID
jgi:hypothetical protein